jgi:hypothetical protein
VRVAFHMHVFRLPGKTTRGFTCKAGHFHHCKYCVHKHLNTSRTVFFFGRKFRGNYSGKTNDAGESLPPPLPQFPCTAKTGRTCSHMGTFCERANDGASRSWSLFEVIPCEF